MKTMVALVSLAVGVGGAAMVAAPQQRPGDPTPAKVWVQNREAAERIPVSLREVGGDVVVRTQVTALPALTLAPGTVVTTPRHQVDTIVTEHGVADLQGKTVHQRGQALAAIALDLGQWRMSMANAWAKALYAVVLSDLRDGREIRARMFSPAMGIPEDPASGAAVVALAGFLADNKLVPLAGSLSCVIRQGVVSVPPQAGVPRPVGLAVPLVVLPDPSRHRRPGLPADELADAAAQRPAVDLEHHGLRKVALRDAADHPRHLGLIGTMNLSN